MIKRLCQCIGLSSVMLAMNYGDLLGGGSDVRMHVPFPLTGICLAQIADIVLLGLLLFVILQSFKSTRYYPYVRLTIAIVIPPYLIQRLRAEIPFQIPDGFLILSAVIWGIILLVLLFKYNLWFRRLLRLGDAIGIFFACFALFSIISLLYVIRWRPGPQHHDVAWAQTPQPPRDHPKIVWIVFDELSFEQVFARRAKDLPLPNFDALRDQSTLFTDVQPVGYKTVKIIPSLLSGNGVDNTHFSFNNVLSVHYFGQHGWHPLGGNQTVFGDAQQAGWRTAAVGWYNPYCTIYAPTIDDCYWMNHDRIDGNMAQSASFWRNTWNPMLDIVRQIKAPARADRDTCTFDVRQRLQTHLDLEAHALKTLHNDQADLVFLHMGVPHSPNIWSRIDDNYTTFCDSSYLDNLALADKVLGKFMAELQASPRWKDTTVIVEGDHGWRIDLWNWLPAWTDEDDAASRNGFDPRPALIIHQPGQSQPQTNATAWPLLNIHGVVEETLHSEPVRY